MDFNQEQEKELRRLFDRVDVRGKGVIDEEGVKELLLEFEIDDSFAPALSWIFRKSGGIRFGDLLWFLKVLISGNTEEFFRVLFEGIGGGDGERALGLSDLMSLGRIFGDELNEAAARGIMKQCDADADGEVNFASFWKWYKQQHGITDEK